MPPSSGCTPLVVLPWGRWGGEGAGKRKEKESKEEGRVVLVPPNPLCPCHHSPPAQTHLINNLCCKPPISPPRTPSMSGLCRDPTVAFIAPLTHSPLGAQALAVWARDARSLPARTESPGSRGAFGGETGGHGFDVNPDPKRQLWGRTNNSGRRVQDKGVVEGRMRCCWAAGLEHASIIPPSLPLFLSHSLLPFLSLSIH